MGLTLFASHNPDLVILDLGLPDRDGLEFIRTVRQKYMTPIVVLSALSLIHISRSAGQARTARRPSAQ